MTCGHIRYEMILINVVIRNSNQDQLFNLIKHTILKNLCQNHQKLEQN
jgi:hypothetical protein